MSVKTDLKDADDGVPRVQKTVFYRENGVVRSVTLVVPEVPGESGDESLGKSAEASDDADENDVSVKKLVSALTEMYNEGERFLSQLCETAVDGGETLLGEQLARLEALDSDGSDKLHFLRVKRKVGAPASDDALEFFTEPTIKDLSDPAVSRYFPGEVRADYEAMAPRVNRVRMLLVENLRIVRKSDDDEAVDDEYIVMQRMFVYAARRCDAASGEDEIEPGNQRAAVHYIAWGYTIAERSDARQAVDDGERGALTDEQKERAQLAEKRLKEAQALYQARRAKKREKIIEAQLPQIKAFMVIACSEALVRRMDEAAPNLPPPLVLHVPMHKARIIDKDNVFGTTVRDVRARKEELTQEAIEISKRLREQSERAGATGATEAQKTEAACTMRQTVALKNALSDVESLEQALGRINPETQVLLDIRDKGKMQDDGRDLKALVVVDVPYKALRSRLAYIAKKLAEDDAEEAKSEQAAAPAAAEIVAK